MKIFTFSNGYKYIYNNERANGASVLGSLALAGGYGVAEFSGGLDLVEGISGRMVDYDANSGIFVTSEFQSTGERIFHMSMGGIGIASSAIGGGSIIRGSTGGLGRSVDNAVDNIRPDFYVHLNGPAVPSTGFRAIGGQSNIDEALGGVINSREPTYFTFDNITNMSPAEAQDLLQLELPPTHSVSFDTLQIIDDINIPDGRWNTNGIPEPITSTFPEWGEGGGTQAITNSPIQVNPLDINKLNE